MKRALVLVSALCTGVLAAVGEIAPAGLHGTLPEDGRVLFRPGETMRFTLTADGLPASAVAVDWTRTGDDGRTSKGRFVLAERKPMVVETALDRPGFVRLRAVAVDAEGHPVAGDGEGGVARFDGGAGVRPDLLCAGDEPADYEAFWQGVLKELDASPIAAELVPSRSDTPDVDVFTIRIPCPGGYPVTGFVTIPSAAKDGRKFPIRAFYHGASSKEVPHETTGPTDAIKAVINVNGYEIGRDEAYYRAFFRKIAGRGTGYGMDDGENASRDTTYWKGLAMRAIRYLQWLKTLPAWNGRDLLVGGGSQGNWQGLVAAARVPGVTEIACNAPWGCDWAGSEKYGRLGSTYKPRYQPQSLAYFDAVFAARRIRCPVRIHFAGLGDDVCPPSTLAVLYNNLKVPKEITYVQGSTHALRPKGVQRETVDGGFDRWNRGRGTCRDPYRFICDALARGERTVTLPKGEYWLTPPRSEGVYMPFRGLRDATIDFGGSRLVGTLKTRMFFFVGCTNLTVRNVTVDYADLPFTQATIEKVGPQGEWDVRLLEGYPEPDLSEEGDGTFWPVQAYDRRTLELRNPMRFRDGLKVTKTGCGTYRITGGKDRRGEVGDIAVWSVKEPVGPTAICAFEARECAGCVFENIVEYATPHGVAFSEVTGDGNTYRGCAIDRCPPEEDLFPRALKRLRSGNHDAFMVRGSVRGPKILGCTAKYHCDDCVNINGMYALIASAEGTTARMIVNHFGLAISPGDTCQLLAYDGRPLPDVTVAKVEDDGAPTEAEYAWMETLGFWPGIARSCRKAYRLTLAAPADLPKATLIVSNRRQGNGFEIRDCDFGHSRARGILVRASEGVIAHNRIGGCAGTAILLGPEYLWMEGGFTRDLLIRDNLMDGNGGGVTYGGCCGKPGPDKWFTEKDYADRNIRVVDSHCTFGQP